MKHLVAFGAEGKKKSIKLSKVIAHVNSLADDGKSPILYSTGSPGADAKAQPVGMEQYLQAPCGTLPKPYAVCGGSAEGFRHIAGEGIMPSEEMPADAYCRLFRSIGDMQRMRSDRFSVRQLFIKEDADDRALLRSLAAEEDAESDLDELILLPYFCDKLCVAVHERATGVCVCAAIGCFDKDSGEAWLQCILPGSTWDEAVRLALNELLRRMAPMTEFVTACAPTGSALEHALRKSGFTGGDIWAE